MRLYEITGDIRPYHFRAPNPAIATAVVMVIGEGQYGWRDLRRGGMDMPVYRVPESRDKWAQDRFGMKLNQVLQKVSTNPELTAALYRALMTIELGMPGEDLPDPVIDRRDLRKQAKVVADRIARLFKKKRRLH